MHDGRDVSITSEREIVQFFFSPLWVYEPGQDCSPHWSDLRPLTISDSDGEVIIMGSHSKKLHLFHHLSGHESLIIRNPWWDKTSAACWNDYQCFFLSVAFWDVFPLRTLTPFNFCFTFSVLFTAPPCQFTCLPKQLLWETGHIEMQRSKKAKLKQAVWCWICKVPSSLCKTQSYTYTHTHIFEWLYGRRLCIFS